MTILIHRILVALSKKGCHILSPPSTTTDLKHVEGAWESLVRGCQGGDGAYFYCCFLTPLPLLQK